MQTADKVEKRGETERGDTVEVQGVRLTSPDKVLFPAQGTTKRTLAEYLVSVQDQILAHAARRPLTLVRCPRGRTQKCFFQKHHGAGLPPGILPVEVREKDGKRATYVYIEDLAGLLGTVQVGALELHLWGSTIHTLEQPDRLVLDLDPDDTLDFSAVKNAALHLRDVLKSSDLQSFPLLTGGKGIHVVIPLRPEHDWDDVKVFARGIARKMADQFPNEFVATASKEKRKGKIFIDWLRNDRGATAISPYATRARENCPIATPVSWRELPRMRAGNQYNISNISRRLSSLKSDPWQGYFSVGQIIPAETLETFRRR